MLSDRCLSVLSVTLVGWTRTPLGVEVGPGPDHIVLDRGPAPQKGGTAAPTFWPPTKKGTAPPHFSAHFALARSPISATAELLLVFMARRNPRLLGESTTS